MVNYMRSRLYLAVVLTGMTPVAFATSVVSWNPAWQQPIAAGGPVSLSHALTEITPGGQTVILNLPPSLKDRQVSWPSGTRQEALTAALGQADGNASISNDVHCPGGLLVISDRNPSVSPPPVTLTPTTAPHAPSSVATTYPLSSATAPAAPASRTQSPAPPVDLVIVKGELMSKALTDWGLANGWTIVWKAEDWRAPANAVIPGKFLEAVRLWAGAAITNGAPIRLVEYQGNNTLLIESTIQDDNGF